MRRLIDYGRHGRRLVHYGWSRFLQFVGGGRNANEEEQLYNYRSARLSASPASVESTALINLSLSESGIVVGAPCLTSTRCCRPVVSRCRRALAAAAGGIRPRKIDRNISSAHRRSALRLPARRGMHNTSRLGRPQKPNLQPPRGGGW